MPLQLQRDPFSRATLMREVAFRNPPDKFVKSANPGVRGVTIHSCDWCGRIPRTLYRYWWQPDDRPIAGAMGHEFCSVDCWRSYND